ncbi:MAG: hypothetical protein PHN55_00820 [Dysgonamonadaceae bacterium]|nr:hypothetical protein [Dysgonamonadaceae bacterium]
MSTQINFTILPLNVSMTFDGFFLLLHPMYLFNPDNDLALANFNPNFTAPASARKLRSDLSLLPIWYASDEAFVIAEGGLNLKHLQFLKEKLPFNNTLISFAELTKYTGRIIKPWGWSPSVRKQFIEKGVEEQLLPSIGDIQLIRNYSSRQNAVSLLAELKKLNAFFCGESYFYSDINTLLDYVYSTKVDQVLKMPYSGSGKGIVWIKGAITDKQIDWCKRVINTQGGVVIEPVLNKVQDFAMEFEVTDNGIQFVGYSLFQAAASGAYIGNILLPDSEIENVLSKYVSFDVLNQLRTALEKKLSTYFPLYRGFLGVDMMICKTNDSTYQLQPCVEVNVRMNMGIVAHRVHQRFVHKGSTGVFSINYFKHETEAQQFVRTMQSKYPLAIENGKIKNGYLSLTPVDKDTRYIACVSIAQNQK